MLSLNKIAAPLRSAWQWIVRQIADRLKDPKVALLQSLQQRNTALQDSMNLILQSMSTQNAATREGRRHLLALDQQMADLTAMQEKALTRLSTVESKAVADHAHLLKMGDGLVTIERRAEFVRRELMFEFSSRQGLIRGATDEAVGSRILNRVKFEQAKDDMRVNLGCGHVPLTGFINVDSRELPGVDVLSDVKDMPFAPGSLAEIRSEHMLEHFPLEELRRVLLPYWISLLKQGGRFIAVVPDADSMIQSYVNGGMTFDELREVTFGLQEYFGDQHYTMFSQESLADLLRGSGLSEVRIVSSGRRNGICFEMEVEGVLAAPSDNP